MLHVIVKVFKFDDLTVNAQNVTCTHDNLPLLRNGALLSPNATLGKNIYQLLLSHIELCAPYYTFRIRLELFVLVGLQRFAHFPKHEILIHGLK